jgi:hypothetical protein
VAFNGDAVRELAGQFLALAETQGATVPRMIGHRLMGMSLLNTGDVVEGRAHLDRAIALYEPAEHRPLATRFGQDIGVTILSWRAFALWLLGYPEAALALTTAHGLSRLPRSSSLRPIALSTARSNKLEQRVGPEGRKLFERFLRQVNKLQADRSRKW